jgi:hypothetical protein
MKSDTKDAIAIWVVTVIGIAVVVGLLCMDIEARR